MADRGKPVSLPVGYRGTVRIQDVVDLVAEIGPGMYDRDDLYRKYMAFVDGRDRVGGNPHAFGQVLSELGHEKVTGWRVT